MARLGDDLIQLGHGHCPLSPVNTYRPDEPSASRCLALKRGGVGCSLLLPLEDGSKVAGLAPAPGGPSAKASAAWFGRKTVGVQSVDSKTEPNPSLHNKCA